MIVISKIDYLILAPHVPVNELNHRRVINDVDVIKHLFVVYICDNKNHK